VYIAPYSTYLRATKHHLSYGNRHVPSAKWHKWMRTTLTQYSI